MKRILSQLLLLLLTVAASAQITMTLGGKKYKVSEVDSIVFKYVDIPSVTTCMNNAGDYSILAQALVKTGLADSLITYEKGNDYEVNSPTDRDGNMLYYPKECNIGWTVFAEKDEVFRAMGINNFDDLAAKCREWYGNPTWFDLINEKGINISTGSDYNNEWNVVHMFVAYHIVRANMPVDRLLYERNNQTSS